MKRIIIWGTGLKARRLCRYLNYDEVEIIGFTDNSGNKDVKLWNGYQYLAREEAMKCIYDYIVIASASYCEITTELMADGIDSTKIIQAYNVQYMAPDTLYFFNQVEHSEEKRKVFTDINLFACEGFC